MTTHQRILITGCQRSGSTLISLILDSHPDIHSIDELDFRNEKLPEYLASDMHVAFKLPIFSHAVDTFDVIPNLRIIWCLRDPRDVIASMLKLQIMPQDYVLPTPWPGYFGQIEIENALKILLPEQLEQLQEPIEHFREICELPFYERRHHALLYSSALCWRVKQESLKRYDENKFNYALIRYEDLVQSPEAHINNMMAFLDIPWHDDLLRHHELHEEIQVGNTDAARAIDTQSVGKWKESLTDEDLVVIRDLCGDAAKQFGYDLEK